MGDKIAHFLAFCVIGFILAQVVRHSFIALLICGLISLINELVQSLSPSRDSLSATDMLFDAAGYCFGVSLFVIAHLFFRIQTQKIRRG